jgi:exonuclease VII small subunit
MKNDVSIEKILQELDEKMAWFHGDDFRLEEAKERFAELKKLAERAETALETMQHDIEVLTQDFSE